MYRQQIYTYLSGLLFAVVDIGFIHLSLVVSHFSFYKKAHSGAATHMDTDQQKTIRQNILSHSLGNHFLWYCTGYHRHHNNGIAFLTTLSRAFPKKEFSPPHGDCPYSYPFKCWMSSKETAIFKVFRMTRPGFELLTFQARSRLSHIYTIKYGVDRALWYSRVVNVSVAKKQP